MFGTASVIAIPGSGKTTAMTHRIANLVRNGVAPENILGLTFTRNAAQQMRQKLKPVLNSHGLRGKPVNHTFILPQIAQGPRPGV